MRTFDEVVMAVVNKSDSLFRNVSAEYYRQAIKDRIEQLHGMAELCHWFGYPFLAQRFELHIEALKQTLDRY
jgi:hypothetical protein